MRAKQNASANAIITETAESAMMGMLRTFQRVKSGDLHRRRVNRKTQGDQVQCRRFGHCAKIEEKEMKIKEYEADMDSEILEN